MNRKIDFFAMHRNAKNDGIDGWVKPGFEPVYLEFLKNHQTRRELGSSLCVYHQGEKVIDLWGGYMDREKKNRWTENTLVLFFSATKGIASLCLARLHSQGIIRYDEKVSEYWPEFAQNAKEHITVSQLLSHQSGLCLWEGKLSVEEIQDQQLLTQKLEKALPMWTPGDYSGYSAGLAGFYMSVLLSKVDAKHRSLGQYFQEELAGPLGLEFYIGLPDSIPQCRVAHIKLVNPLWRILTLGRLPKGLRKTVSNPGSLFLKSIALIKGYDVNHRATWKIEEPSGNGIGTARSVARLYGLLACDHHQLGISDETMQELTPTALIPNKGSTDKVMGIPLYYRNGFMKNGPGSQPFNNSSCVGFGGASGSMAFADPMNQIGYCYVPNMQGYDFPDSREANLQKALYQCLH